MKLSKIAAVSVTLLALFGNGAFAQSQAVGSTLSATGATAGQVAAATAFGSSIGATAIVSAALVGGVLVVTFQAPTGTISTSIPS